eukprot:TRINITY_DN50569_c0_g1_i1.p1 TRINITY_DN50569_c0_g1~~TRINITY_DN50569_c0_g1_i1.p1  ORF type:complete len:415 (+),score=67.49 TRINITY_DN50569_c0_g1_i1:39-1283(+)
MVRSCCSNDFCSKSYTQHRLHGLHVWVDDDCNEEEVLRMLEEDVGAVARAYPAKAWQSILKQGSQLWINQNFCYKGDSGEKVEARGACAHHCENWLASHGNLPAKARCVEVYSWEDYKNFCLSRVGVIAHEFAHVYHGILGFQQPDISQSFASAMASGKYESVPHSTGCKKKAYACVNELEFFASLCVPYFGFENDYYPFTRADLESFDPASLKMLDKVWGMTSPKRPVTSKQSFYVSLAHACSCCCGRTREEQMPKYMKWTQPIRIVLADGSGMCLAVGSEDDKCLVVARDAAANLPVNATTWLVTPADSDGYPGFYRLSATSIGANVCLDLSNPQHVPVLRPRADVGGQYWRFEPPVGGGGASGGHRFTTLWLGTDKALSCRSGPAPKRPHMQAIGDDGTAFWHVEPFHPGD